MTKEQLIWDDAQGVGFLPAQINGLYGADYWKLYQDYRSSPTAKSLMEARVSLSEQYVGPETLVDIGIGSGHFIEARGPSTWGYDVNPHAIYWLLDRGLWWNPWFKDPPNAAFWDSLEHLERPDLLVARVKETILVSIPVFRNKDHVLSSKHYKPGEHLWYFTADGFTSWMKRQGFRLVEENRMETELGREDIGTFVFKRR